MKLKTRLIVSFFIMVFVPLFLAGIVIIVFGNYQLRFMEKSYGLDNINYESFSNSIHVLDRMTQDIYEELKLQGKTDSSVFEDAEYLDKVNENLKENYSYLLVKRDDVITYKGTNDDINLLVEKLPEYGSYTGKKGSGIYLGDDIQILVKPIDVLDEDNSKITVFIVTPVGNVIPQVKNFIFETLIAIILILLVTSAVLTVWIYKGIIKPLRKLKKATNNIKEGNLNFSLESEKEDEIGELCINFEEMRQRLKASAEEKVEHDRESKELISNISHDLKTPITAIKGYVEGIMDGVADTPEKVDKYIRTIYNKANDMDRLINELTFYSKIDTNRIPYAFNRLNVGEYFEDCAEEESLELESKNIEFGYFNYVDESVEIIADAEQIRRVIYNIIGNSNKYIGKKKGIINIRLKDVGDYVQVEIEDNGKGIPAADLPYIFDRFFRSDVSRNSSQGGSGIGLSIVKKIVEDHGGKIWATSKEDTGTVMYFVLRKYQEVPVNE